MPSSREAGVGEGLLEVRDSGVLLVLGLEFAIELDSNSDVRRTRRIVQSG